jgi:hypothetical protein
VASVVGLLLITKYDRITIGDGWPMVAIHLRAGQEPILRARVVVCRGRFDIHDTLRHGPLPDDRYRSGYETSANPFSGEPLRVEVPCTVRRDGWGCLLSYSQFSHWVIFIETPSGWRVQVEPIPDLRQSREVTILVHDSPATPP